MPGQEELKEEERKMENGMRQKAVIITGVVLLAAALAGAVAWWLLRPEPDLYADVKALLDTRYGDYDPEQKLWLAPADPEGDEAGTTLAFKLCMENTVRAGDVEKVLVAVCGFMPEGGSHADSGRVDFFVLEKEFRGLRLLAQLEDTPSGTFGEPGEVSVVRLGREFFGFKIEDGWTGQGNVIQVARLFVPRDDTLQQALSVSVTLDNESAGACEGESMSACTRLTRTIAIDDRLAEASIYPLVITEKGLLDGKERSGTYEIPFDKKRWGYVLPAVLEEGGF
jgi:hypothetical protein